MSIYEKSKAKDIIADKEKLNSIVATTIDKMATIVGATLGPGGRGVLIERDGMSPLVTKDGVTVAKSLGLDRAEANIIIEAAKEICINTAKSAGDGTTTAIVLANAITQNGQRFLNANPKYNPQRLINELNDLYDSLILPFLKENSLKVESEEQLRHVAEISANGDKKIADLVVKAVMGAGDDGNVLIQEAQGDVMRMEPLDGYVIVAGLKELGQIGPAFINDKANQQVKMDKGIVFLWDGSMHDLQVPAAIQTAIEGTDFYGSPILVFAHDFSDLVLEKFAKTAKGGITIAPIKTPMSGVPNSRSMFLSDMAAYTGATVYHPGNLEQFLEDEEEGFGLFQEAKVGIFESLVIAEPDPDQLEARIGELRSVHDAALDEITKMHVRASISRLTGGIVTIWVGGASDLEVKEKKHRVEDAVEAVRSAIAEGVVPGGCGVHLVLADMMKRSPNRKQSWEIMEKALTAPFGLLMSNCGEDAEQVYSEFLKDHIENVNALPKLIFDANNHEMVEPFKGGIIEPAKVVRVSVGNALSVASLLMTLGGIVVVPRDSQLENQLAMSKQAFNDMMASGLGG